MIKPNQSWAEYFSVFFGDKSGLFYEIFPEVEPEDPGPHLSLDDYFASNAGRDEPLKRYSHCCWCNPELVFADDSKGNEAWLHKRVN